MSRESEILLREWEMMLREHEIMLRECEMMLTECGMILRERDEVIWRAAASAQGCQPSPPPSPGKRALFLLHPSGPALNAAVCLLCVLQENEKTHMCAHWQTPCLCHTTAQTGDSHLVTLSLFTSCLRAPKPANICPFCRSPYHSPISHDAIVSLRKTSFRGMVQSRSCPIGGHFDPQRAKRQSARHWGLGCPAVKCLGTHEPVSALSMALTLPHGYFGQTGLGPWPPLE